MLTARRDPPLHSDAPDRAHSPRDLHLMAGHPASSSGYGRFVNFLQVAGSLLAIPLGLASGYSIYHSNFSPEAQCQSLRTNIVSMLDKNADASTLRALVRRDVVTFENTCGSVDPEAVAAFKTLLAGKPAVAARTPAPQPQHVAHEPVRPLHEAAKPAPAKPAAAEAKAAPAVTEAKPAPHDSAASDANWVASVRDALIHAPAPHADVAAAPAAAPAPAPVQPAAPPLRALRDTQAPALSLAPPAPAPHETAPVLPPAASVAAAPAPELQSNHPVPPASIPDPVLAPAAEVEPPKPHASGIRGVIAQIPLVGHWVRQ